MLFLAILATVVATASIPEQHVLENDVADFECTIEGFFPNPDDCQKFIRCVLDGKYGTYTRHDFDCVPGTDLWCQSMLTCSWDYQCPQGCSSGSVHETSPRLGLNDNDAASGLKSDCTPSIQPDPNDDAGYYECICNGNGVQTCVKKHCPADSEKYCDALKACGPAAACPS